MKWRKAVSSSSIRCCPLSEQQKDPVRQVSGDSLCQTLVSVSFTQALLTVPFSGSALETFTLDKHTGSTRPFGGVYIWVIGQEMSLIIKKKTGLHNNNQFTKESTEQTDATQKKSHCPWHMIFKPASLLLMQKQLSNQSHWSNWAFKHWWEQSVHQQLFCWWTFPAQSSPGFTENCFYKYKGLDKLVWTE